MNPVGSHGDACEHEQTANGALVVFVLSGVLGACGTLLYLRGAVILTVLWAVASTGSLVASAVALREFRPCRRCWAVVER